IYNPGAPEAWDLGEFAQEKGYYHVVLEPEGKGKKVEFIPSTPRQIYNVQLDVSKLTNPAEVVALSLEKLGTLWDPKKQGAMVRLELRGEVPFNPLSINQSELISVLHDSFPILHVE